jgi:ribosomal protein RSM22 (predicted rRNA methylase)
VRLKDQRGEVSEASGQDVEWNPLLEFRKARRLAENADEKNAPLTTPSAQILETSDTKNTSETAHESNPTVDSDEEAAIRARNEFGDELPENYLSEQQMLLYKRLYDNPKILSERDIEDSIEETILQRETEDGIWETIEEAQPLLQENLNTLITSSTQDQSTDPTTADPKNIWLEDTDYIRTHPLTLASRWGTSPSTLHFPTTTFTTPITTILNDSNSSGAKHLSTAAESILGGVGLPYSPSTPAISRTMPQQPVPLRAAQARMTDAHADVFLAAVLPQTYAAVLSVLVEVRKRLGGAWLKGLMARQGSGAEGGGGGPLVLDVGGAGAGVLAWREIVRAEWEVVLEERESKEEMVKNPVESLFALPDLAKDEQVNNQPPQAPFGKATVVTGSDTLRYRSSRLLENTTFIPRIPDLVPDEVPEGASPRKQYDVIIAPHSLWNLSKDYESKTTVETLWSLLNPAGGVLILLEKGVPRGFEAIAGARELLLKKHIAHQSLPDEAELGEEADDEILLSSFTKTGSNSIQSEGKDEGMIVAPCTNHSVCPLYTTPGLGQGRKDWCHFSQRYIRPPFLQSVLGAKRRNHDDVEFSYLAVRRGVDLRRKSPSISSLVETQEPRVQIQQDEESTDKAFLGYGRETMVQDAIEEAAEEQHAEGLDIFRETEEQPVDEAERISKRARALIRANDREHWVQEGFDPLMLPRMLLTPIKRKGHILIDLCTPMGTYERWLVNRRTGKQAWRDARKSKWGDLWALGAWSRDIRRVNLGTVNKKANVKSKKSKRGKQRLSKEEAEAMKELAQEETTI